VKLRCTPVMERSKWDASLADLPQPHVLQTWDWGEFKSHWGWQPTRLLFEEANHPLAAAQILKRALPGAPFSICYAPKGPALNFADTALLVEVLSALEQHARRQHCLFIKIDPDVWLGQGPGESPPSPNAAAVLERLSQRGWLRSKEQIQFKNTIILDLFRDEQDLMARMKAKTRYNIRLTARRGVSIRLGSERDLGTFYGLYHQTSQRDGFLIRPPAYYMELWAQFLQAGRAHILIAEVNSGEAIAGLILFHFGRKAWYMYGASSSSYRDLMPNHRLQWEAIRLAKELGCTQYDMWGAPDRFDESDPMWGVYHFKVGFGGETMRGAGAFDYAPLPWRYWLYRVVMPRMLDLMRRRHDFQP